MYLIDGQHGMSRRGFMRASAGAFAAAGGLGTSRAQQMATVPRYLAGYEEVFARDPREASTAWFADAGFGLFMHMGLYSLLGRGEWVMFNERIPVRQYEQLASEYRAARFDADFITDLALAAEMRYLNITSRHHDSYCLFDSRLTGFNSMDTAPRRDLVGELSEQCQKKGLGLFLYYSYALDWRHPYYYSREHGSIARPAYASPDPAYKWQRDEDFQHYVEFVHGQIRELLTNYGPIAGMWFDPIMGYYARPDLFPADETYALVRALQPQCLISFKQGATGTEDFAAPERSGHSLADRVEQVFKDPARTEVARHAWESNRDKHNEICDTLQPGAWGYRKADDDQHRQPEAVHEMLAAARSDRCNLLLNTGPLPDGSIHPVDVRTLRTVGMRLRREN